MNTICKRVCFLKLQFFLAGKVEHLAQGTWILNSFGTSGENNENVLVKICKGI